MSLQPAHQPPCTATSTSTTTFTTGSAFFTSVNDCEAPLPPQPSAPPKPTSVVASDPATKVFNAPTSGQMSMSTEDEWDEVNIQNDCSLKRAFLTQLEDDGSITCVASGEYRPDEGVFAVDAVLYGHENIDLAGVRSTATSSV
eukprot:CAMPEP_0184380526 /NCGR_PEP_ID=MMETSP0007-20130409/4827_1 /TAXON_ID=97485 /ORGANISM="Prymnesium parvum, Strain Texoma1" /LENGTH=142 /DNA_ID=CAMNT_0026725799 /DNA_START=355 /DNA_END=780 /DNA_ORIENTATION=+